MVPGFEKVAMKELLDKAAARHLARALRLPVLAAGLSADQMYAMMADPEFTNIYRQWAALTRRYAVEGSDGDLFAAETMRELLEEVLS